MKHVIFIALSCLIVFIITLYFRLGGHKNVEITQKNLESTAVVYTDHLGPYHKVNDSIVKVEKWATDHNLPCQKTFGVYLDNPNTSDPTRLRSEVGCILDGITSVSLTDKLPDWLKFKSYPDGEFVVATFTGAPSIGPMKVYPAVDDYLKEKRLVKKAPPMEIYSFSGEREALTEYRFLIEPTTK